MEPERDRNREGIPLFMWLLLIIAIAGSALYAVPRIIRNYRESGLADIVAEYRSRTSGSVEAEYQETFLYFVSIDREDDQDSSMTNYNQACTAVEFKLENGLGLNGLIEQLLQGPDIASLQAGMITLIPDDVQLLGSKIVDGAAYINFSDELAQVLEDGNYPGYICLQQVIGTAASLSYVDQVIILINGEPVTFPGILN